MSGPLSSSQCVYMLRHAVSECGTTAFRVDDDLTEELRRPIEAA